MTALAEWARFYGIVGPSAGTLIGLQFVVMTLVAGRPIVGGEGLGKTYATPTIVHFSAVLLLSALVSAPWQGLAIAAVLWGLVGLAGAIYVLIVARRLRMQSGYQPVFEDWLFHAQLPFAAYVVLTVSACAAPSHVREALVGIGAAVLVLLFVGVHNAWDAVAYHVFVKNP